MLINYRKFVNLPTYSLKIIMVAVCALITQESFSQNTLDKAGLNSSTPASVAYSMRLLSTGYAGAALNIRRSSDNATQDIGFTAGGNLDTSTLKTFIGANDGLVTIWYDQSGNSNNLTQATTTTQPKLVNAGTIYRENGIPFIRFFGVAGGNPNSLALAADMTIVGHVSAVHLFASGGDGFILGHSGNYYWHSNPPSNLINSTYASGSVQGGSAWSNGASSAPTSIPWPTVLTINELAPSSPSGSTTWNNIGSDRVFHHTTGGGGYSELIVFPTGLSTSNRQALETNQGAYFSISTFVLPVTWMNFTAELQKENILLKWQTASEQNSKEFNIQFSRSGNNWINLATISASGNSSSIRSYSYLHTSPLPGSNLYRILQRDLDGKISYSPIRTVQFISERSDFTLLVNPIVNGELLIQVPISMNLSIYNSDGKLLWTKQLSEGRQRVDISGYPRGTYLLKGNTMVRKFVVE